ncbi:armadillo-type protein [Collybia nuda]|uniref:Armadillo-type protein n=1 Tax=Collybia nuda TaxID=64659 RepID=A0A9P6CB40_9AGAR|nr:armadillo-type protein [Collybia nuda]
MIVYQQRRFSETYLLPHIAEFFRILACVSQPPLTDEEDATRTSILSIICMFFSLSKTSRNVMASHADSIIIYLRNNDAVDRYNIVSAIEELADEEPSSRDAIHTSLKAHLFETFDYIVVGGHRHVTQFFLAARAFELVLSSMSSPDVDTRIAAQSCLTQLYAIAEMVDSHRDVSAGTPGTTKIITSAFIKALHDESPRVVTGATDFLNGTAGDEVKEIFVQDIMAIASLVISLGNKETQAIGTGAEWFLIKLGEGNSNELIKLGFKQVWCDDNIPLKTKLKIIRGGVIDTFLDIRTAALDGGLCDLMLDVIEKNNEHRLSVLTLLDQLMETEQTVGWYLLESDRTALLLKIVEEQVSAEAQLAFSVLARLLDSYKNGGEDDRISQRPTAVQLLTAPDTLAHIFTCLHSNDLIVVGASANLIAEVISEEEGTQSWSYEEESGKAPPPTPLKDIIVTAELVHYVVSLMKKPKVSKDALHLLCQFCWGYPRGFNLVKKAFEACVPDGDVFFFASLYGDFLNKHAGRQRRCVANAACLAGALDRTFLLLEREATSDAEHRRAAVEGLRVILCADSADVNLARKNVILPSVLSSLVADVCKESLGPVLWFLRLLENEEDQSWLLDWTEFGNPETVQNFLKLLNKFSYSTNPDGTGGPKKETMGEGEYERAYEEYTEKIIASQQACKELTDYVVEIIRLSLPIISPHASPLLGPLLIRSSEMTDNTNINNTLNALLSAHNGNNETLVVAFKQLLEQSSPPSINQLDEWITSGPALSSAALKAGVADWLLKIFSVSEEHDLYSSRKNALSTLATLIKNSPNIDSVRGLQKAYFDDEKALLAGIEFVLSEDDPWDAANAADDLRHLSDGFPPGINCLRTANIFPALLKLFDDAERPVGGVPYLIGLLCTPGDKSLTTLLHSYVSALTEPPSNTEADVGEGNKKKKKKKKRAYTPRMSETDIWDRFIQLAPSSPTAVKAVLDAGAVDAAKALFGKIDEEKTRLLLRGLKVLVENDSTCAEAVSIYLPRVAELLLMDDQPFTSLLHLARAFIPTHIALLVSSGVHVSLVRALGEFPSAFDDMLEMVNTLYAIAESSEGRAAVVSALNGRLTAENVEEYEASWGYVHGLRRLLDAGEAGPNTAMDAGAVPFVIKMLSSETLSVNPPFCDYICRLTIIFKCRLLHRHPTWALSWRFHQLGIWVAPS